MSEAAKPQPLPEDFLAQALAADSARKRAQAAREGLALDPVGVEPDTHVLLLRQLYIAQLDEQQLGDAADTALQMTRVGAMPDVAHHDLARVLFALDREDEAIHHQRLAGRAAPPSRRSFHLWSLATLQHFAGHPEDAISTLHRALRWAGKDRPLLEAHAAYVELDCGGVVEELSEVVATLEAAKCREGYGEFLLGMIYHQLGDAGRAATFLRAFLRRNAAADAAKIITLREELRRARAVLARLSD